MDFSVFFLFCSTVILLTIIPGPDIIYVISQSLHKGYRHGVMISIGLVTGLFIYTIATSIGISWILDKFPNLSTSIKIIGAFYIGYLAYQEFPNEEKTKNIEIRKNTNPFFSGLIMNLSNPKIILFFTSLFPQFIFHDKLPIKYQFLILGTVFIIIALSIFSFVAILSNYLINKKRLSLNPKYFSYLSSLVLGSISISLLFSEIKDVFK